MLKTNEEGTFAGLGFSGKLIGSYVILTLLTVLCGATGWIASDKLAEALDYITGPAWDTADGAMEGTIAIQQDMLEIMHLIAVTGADGDAQRDIGEGVAIRDEALGRMNAAGTVDSDLLAGVTAALGEFDVALESLRSTHQDYRVANAQLESNRIWLSCSKSWAKLRSLAMVR